MNKLYLQNNRLKIEILMPGEVYKQSRFDWMGMISQVTLDDRNTFCVKESLISGIGTNGVGLSNEFGIEEPIGYEEAKVGGKFPKLGVGLLTKVEETDYKFHVDYDIEPFSISFIKEGDNIRFLTDTKKCGGYEFKQSKTISIKDNSLKISYWLENVGTKPISTTEYIHNFLGINNHPIGPEYKLRLSKGLEVEDLPKGFINNSNEISLNKEVGNEFYFKTKSLKMGKGQFWELIHEPSAVGVRETVDFVIERFAVWGRPHVISPEAFVKIDIKPGEIKEWSREFDFFD